MACFKLQQFQREKKKKIVQLFKLIQRDNTLLISSLKIGIVL